MVDERADAGPVVPGEAAAPADVPGAARDAVDHSRDLFSIANVITVLRLALIPFFYWALVYGGNDDLAFGLFVLAASTDWVDGQIARRTGHVTNVGKLIDPLVDRLLIAASLIGLYVVQPPRIHMWLLVVLIARDVYLLYGAWVLERHGRRLEVSFLGKATTMVLLIGFAGLVWNRLWIPMPVLATVSAGPIHFVLGGERPLGAYLVYAGLVLSVTSAVQYSIAARRTYREALAKEKAARAAATTDGRER